MTQLSGQRWYLRFNQLKNKITPGSGFTLLPSLLTFSVCQPAHPPGGAALPARRPICNQRCHIMNPRIGGSRLAYAKNIVFTPAPFLYSARTLCLFSSDLSWRIQIRDLRLLATVCCEYLEILFQVRGRSLTAMAHWEGCLCRRTVVPCG